LEGDWGKPQYPFREGGEAVSLRMGEGGEKEWGGRDGWGRGGFEILQLGMSNGLKSAGSDK